MQLCILKQNTAIIIINNLLKELYGYFYFDTYYTWATAI